MDPLQELIGGNGDAFVAKLIEDADSDGVADAVDACPSQEEDFDTIQDSDGCPETDADGDLIFDEVDEAPLGVSIRFSDRPLRREDIRSNCHPAGRYERSNRRSSQSC